MIYDKNNNSKRIFLFFYKKIYLTPKNIINNFQKNTTLITIRTQRQVLYENND